MDQEPAVEASVKGKHLRWVEVRAKLTGLDLATGGDVHRGYLAETGPAVASAHDGRAYNLPLRVEKACSERKDSTVPSRHVRQSASA